MAGVPYIQQETQTPSGSFNHCSAPLDQGQSPAGKAVYPGGPGTKITSVSTGNLCADVSSGQFDPRKCPPLLLVFYNLCFYWIG